MCHPKTMGLFITVLLDEIFKCLKREVSFKDSLPFMFRGNIYSGGVWSDSLSPGSEFFPPREGKGIVYTTFWKIF
jgi:hypothetical protein